MSASPDLWERAAALFAEAAALAAAERRQFVAARAGDDAELRAAVERLIAADAEAEQAGFLDTGAPPGAATAAPLPPAIGRYRVVSRLGRGGFGEVFRAEDPMLKREVAVKTCLAAGGREAQRFLREAEIAARLEHPNISRVYDFGVQGGVPYLVQELLAGEDLAVWIEGRPQPPLAERAGWMLDAARGLAHAHARGVVHRDVKPSNLRRLPDGTVKVLDFGIARRQDASLTLTGAGELLGTVAYLAPEQLRTPGREAGPEVDAYAWGAVAWELLAGRRRLLAESAVAQLYEAAAGASPPLLEVAPDCPPELARVVERALQADPAARYRNAGEIVAALAPALGEAAASPALWRRTRSWARGLRWGWPAAAALAVALWVLAGREAPQAPSPAPLPPADGWLRIDAMPWARIEGVEAVGAPSRAPALEAGAVTPLALAAPPGAYRVRLRSPNGVERICEVQVTLGAFGACAVEFSRPTVAEFLAETLR